MTDLERLALLGDKQAQKECTEKGIVLPCPFCGDKASVRYTGNNSGFKGFKSNVYMRSNPGYISCERCGISSTRHNRVCVSLKKWNTRPAPPIGRCGECKWFECKWIGNFECTNESLSTDHEGGASYSLNFDEHDYCSYFEPRCEE